MPAEGMERLIPAHAGKTGRGWASQDASKAHPRSRGENKTNDLIGVAADGSSPLTRGKLGQMGAALADVRLIPAHAGKTSIS